MQNQPPRQFSPSDTWDGADRVATEFEEALNRGRATADSSGARRIKPEDRARLLPELIGLEIVYRAGPGRPSV